MTPETTSTSNALKTPTTETSGPFAASLKLTSSKKSGKKPKVKNRQIPKENTTSPSESKTSPKVKTDSSVSQPAHKKGATNPSYVKLHGVAQNPTNTPSKKSSAPQKHTRSAPKTSTKEDPAKKISSCPSTANPEIADPSSNYNTDNLTKQYHTLVCYAEKNKKIASELKIFLETEYNLQVCIDFANFIPGKATADNITESITSSESVIFLLSPEFLEKHWAPWELKTAVYDFNASQKSENPKKIIPVLLEECKVPDELKIYTPIKMKDFVSKEDCWRKLATAVSVDTCYSNDSDNGKDENGDDSNNANDGHDDDDDDDDVDDDINDIDDDVNDNDDDDHSVIDSDDNKDNSEGGLDDVDDVHPNGVDSNFNGNSQGHDDNDANGVVNSNDDSSPDDASDDVDVDDDVDDDDDDQNSEVDGNGCGDEHSAVGDYGNDNIIHNSGNQPGDVESL